MAVEIEVVQEHLVLAAIQHAVEQIGLELELRKHLLLDCTDSYKIDYLNLALLAYSVNPAYTLLQDGRIPRKVQIDDV